MIAFAARRLGWAIVTAVVASIVAFVLFWTIPNVDPAYQLGGGQRGTEASRARAAERYGLDDPLPVQYVRLMEGIFNGDVDCLYGCGSLHSAFVEALPVTFWLVAGAALIAIGLGVVLALVCVRHRGRWQDRAILTAATAAYSVPSIVLAALLWAFLAFKWRIFPEGGYVGLTENPFEWFAHLLLPWIAAALPFAGAYVQVVRASLLEAVDEDWVRTARAKGLGEKQVIRRHVLRNGLIPARERLRSRLLTRVRRVRALRGGDLRAAGHRPDDCRDARQLRPSADRLGLAVYLANVVVLASAIVDVIVGWLDPRLRRPRASV